jgi:hypothetical protein
MPVIVKMQLLHPKNALAHEVVGAICMDRTREIIFGWDLEEAELRAHFEGRSFAYFEVEQQPDESWKVLRRMPDQDW